MTALSVAFAGTAKYTCNGNSSLSQEEEASVHRPLKQKLKGSAKAKGMDDTATSVLPTHYEGSPPQLLPNCSLFFDVMSALMSRNNQKVLEGVELLCSPSVKSQSPQCCQFKETKR